MSKNQPTFELPKNIDHYLAAVSKLYQNSGSRQLQEIIVNSKVRIHEQWNSDNWEYGHALYLTVPQSLFLNSLEQKNAIQERIKADLNTIHSIQNEYVAEIFLEMEAVEDSEWRKSSGLLLDGTRIVSTDANRRIWGDHGFRVFLSHKTEAKKETNDLKEQLRLFGASGFVAHRDINPTREWQDEIENALCSMDAFVALLTPNFHESDWTDQEVGYALARGVPILAVRLGKDPYGFIGKFQGLTCSWTDAAEHITKILIRHDRMFNAYIEQLRECPSWDGGNMLGKALPGIETASPKQIEALINAFNETLELRGSFAFNGTKARFYGDGLVALLNRLGSRRFCFDENGQVKEVDHM